MDKELQPFQNLRIQLEEIILATGNFNEKNKIGHGGFGKVYKGEVSHSKGRSMATIKHLDHRQDQDQGDVEFLKEIRALSRYEHENLISLLGFCYQEDEKILVYQLASRGSLEGHLNSPDLTWSKRIKICLDAAKGLRHLHDPRGTHQRLIHCDVKSGNILLDDQWNAKVVDFGFSTMGPANELHSTVVNLAAGTCGYCDPQYAKTNTLTKESNEFLHQFQHFKIQLEEIVSATNNFEDYNCIGVGGFGKAYKGEVSHYKGRSIVAIKRIEFSYGQGEGESDFFEEMMTLSDYRHTNLMPILGSVLHHGE
ncbi:putative serine/threonine-protein kinase PBL7 [Bidens hawaiensis]|uniref:putative serine/threonine-protein kinase PBL7 n=1 Tax=Bidens hawaiensis TaxID=980011 RepID=UPI0040498ED4